MRTPLLTLAATLALGLAATASAQSGGQMYKWKDASGVTHYSQTPPASGQYQTRAIHRGSAFQDSAETKPAVTESPACVRARANLTLLQSDQPLQLEGGDGTPLNPEQRKAQTDLAAASVRANCTPD